MARTERLAHSSQEEVKGTSAEVTGSYRAATSKQSAAYNDAIYAGYNDGASEQLSAAAMSAMIQMMQQMSSSGANTPNGQDPAKSP